jgi:predicted nucleic acid-binding protein
VAVVVDASVALKWVISEADSSAAVALVRSESLIAPNYLFVECANVLWVKARRKQLSPQAAAAALAAIEAVPIRTVPAHAHVAEAQRIAFELDQAVYDCLYLAVALAELSVLVTADGEFLRAAQANAAFAQTVKPLVL